jgi:hypothetical protein
MNPLSLITDGYERKARLYPALVVLAPVVVTVLAIVPMQLSALQSSVGVVVACGGAFLLSQLARDAGKKSEKALFERWGGMPSVAIFRHRDTRVDSITKARYHKKMATLVKAKAPSKADEQADSAGADEVYASWSTYLRVHTRDTKKFPLLFQELVSYGYRRNLKGLRPMGIIASAGSLAVAASMAVMRFRASGTVNASMVAASVAALLFLLLWSFRFSSTWVRLPADAYAERLAETVDAVGGTTKAATK